MSSNMVRYTAFLVAGLLLSSCSELPFGQTDSGPPAADITACDPASDNITAEVADELFLDEPLPANYCRKQHGGSRWWRIAGPFDAVRRDGGALNPRFRLHVEFERGLDAEDLDFLLGKLRGSGDWVDGRVVSGFCDNPAGQSEDCVVEVSASEGPIPYVYVMGSAGSEAEEEVFTVTVKLEPVGDGM